MGRCKNPSPVPEVADGGPYLRFATQDAEPLVDATDEIAQLDAPWLNVEVMPQSGGLVQILDHRRQVHPIGQSSARSHSQARLTEITAHHVQMSRGAKLHFPTASSARFDVSRRADLLDAGARRRFEASQGMNSFSSCS